MHESTDTNIKKIGIYISNYISKLESSTTEKHKSLDNDKKQKYKFLILKYIAKYLLSMQHGSAEYTSGELIKITININNFIKCKLDTGSTDWLYQFLHIYTVCTTASTPNSRSRHSTSGAMGLEFSVGGTAKVPGGKFGFQIDTKEGCYQKELSPQLKTCLTRRFNNSVNHGLLTKDVVAFNVNYINNDITNKITDVEQITVNNITFKLQSIIISTSNHYTVIINNNGTYYYYDNQNYGTIIQIKNINIFFLKKITPTNPSTFIYSNTTIIPTPPPKQPTPPPKQPTPPPKQPTPPPKHAIKKCTNTIIELGKINFICI